MSTEILRNGRHKWGPSVALSRVDFPDGNDRNERICELCGLVRITVIAPGRAWREWRTKAGMVAQIEHTPPCSAAATEGKS